MVHPWRLSSPHLAQGWWGSCYMQPLASGTAQDISQLSPAQPEKGELPRRQPKPFSQVSRNCSQPATPHACPGQVIDPEGAHF